MTTPRPKKPVEASVETQLFEHAIPVATPLMGLDLSLSSTGVGILAPGRFISIRLKAGDLRGMARVKWIMDHIARYIIEQRPAAVMVEGYSMGSVHSHAHSLGELGGVVKLGIGMMGIPTFVAAPGSWKKALTGNGSAKKGEIILSLYKRFGLEISQDDQADSAGLAIVLASTVGAAPLELTKAQQEGLRKIEALPPLARPARHRARPQAGVTGQEADAPTATAPVQPVASAEPETAA